VQKTGTPDEPRQRWVELLQSGQSAAAQELYFEAILPGLLPGLRARPEHREIGARKVHTLVSLMGYSPETTVISTAIVQPERLVVITSENVPESYERMLMFLVQHRILPGWRAHFVPVDPVDYEGIYRAVKAELQTGRENLVDITGGKKVMSATAGAVGWRLDVPLCYVENERWDTVLRRPIPGSETLIILRNPADFKLAELRNEALVAYHKGDYGDAERLFGLGRANRTNYVLEELGIALCSCYRALLDLDAKRLSKAVVTLSDLLENRPNIRDLMKGRLDLERHLRALSAVGTAEDVAFIGTCLFLSDLYAQKERHDFGSLLAYRAMEALVRYGLKRGGERAFNPRRPDWSVLAGAGGVDELELKYKRLTKESGLPFQVGLVSGFALLCIADELHRKPPYEMTAAKAVSRVVAVAERRNKSVLAHGTEVLSTRDHQATSEGARDLARAILAPHDFERLIAHKESLEPPDLSALL